MNGLICIFHSQINILNYSDENDGGNYRDDLEPLGPHDELRSSTS